MFIMSNVSIIFIKLSKLVYCCVEQQQLLIMIEFVHKAIGMYGILEYFILAPGWSLSLSLDWLPVYGVR